MRDNVLFKKEQPSFRVEGPDRHARSSRPCNTNTNRTQHCRSPSSDSLFQSSRENKKAEFCQLESVIHEQFEKVVVLLEITLCGELKGPQLVGEQSSRSLKE